MNGFVKRQLHLVLLISIVFLATLPNWFVHNYVLSEEIEIEENLKGVKIPLKTDDEVVQREEEAISIDGLSVAEKKLLQGEGEAHHFQAEVSRLMHLIINSLYSNKEIFLRELISNASDALDKIRFLSLTDESLLSGKPELEIRLKPDLATRTLRIIDSGIGMTKEELVANLGTIAKSGTSEFLKNYESPSDSDLIGQFGVGFYSAFLVADRVTVTSKNNNDSQHVWTSDASSFSVVEDPEGNTLGRGTEILLHVRDDSLEFLDQEVVKGLILKYSGFINFPIYLWTSRIEHREVVVEKVEEDEEPEEEEGIVIEEDEEEEEEEEDNTEIIEETVWEWVQLNNVQPIWLRDPKDVSDEEYLAFYKSLEENEDIDDPYTWVHFTAEGDLDFKAILYVPQEVPSGLFDAKRLKGTRSVKLYVKRVFITDDFDVILPKYLHFVKGVVDSSSLPLNVSREILQQDKSLKQMEKKLIRKIISMVQKLAQDDEEQYNAFYHDYRVNLKLGIIEDSGNQERLLKLLRFPSSKDPATKTSFDQYVENFLPNQNSIYYLAGEDVASCQQSPLLEKLIEKGYEVLYFVDPIDEYWTQSVSSYEGKRLINIAKENNLNLDLEEDEDPKTLKEEFETLTTFLKSHLGPKVQKVTLSTRLSSTPSAIVASSMGYSANLERILKAQTLGQEIDQFQRAKKVLEINPKHPIIVELNERVKTNPEDQQNRDTADLLFDTAVLHSGFSLDDPSAFAKRIHRIIELGLGVETHNHNDNTEAAENTESSE